MLTFLREENKDGTPGPLSMRRIAAALCLITAIGFGVFSLIIIYQFISGNPVETGALDWKAFVPLFIPSLAFLAGMLLLLFFTTLEDIKGLAVAIAGIKK